MQVVAFYGKSIEHQIAFTFSFFLQWPFEQLLTNARKTRSRQGGADDVADMFRWSDRSAVNDEEPSRSDRGHEGGTGMGGLFGVCDGDVLPTVSPCPLVVC